MSKKEINELKERVNRITELMNQIKAEMDGNFIRVSVSTFSSGSEIHIAEGFDSEFDRWDSSLYRKAFPDFRKVEHDEVNTKLATFIDDVEVFILVDKKADND